jgi:DNA-binding NtrC family response regulator
MSPLAPVLLLFEKSPRWEAELKRRFHVGQVLVRPCRSAADVIVLARQAPGSVVVLDFTAGAAEGLQLLEALFGLRVTVFPVVLASRATQDLDWPARELGAADFIIDPISGDALAEICRRLLAPKSASKATSQAVRARG